MSPTAPATTKKATKKKVTKAKKNTKATKPKTPKAPAAPKAPAVPKPPAPPAPPPVPKIPAVKKEALDQVEGPQLYGFCGETMIWDECFNYARTIMPLREDKTPHTLEGTTSKGSVIGGVSNSPEFRKAEKEEREKWWELHQNDKRVNNDPSKIPGWILTDGYGRFTAHVLEHGMLKILPCRLVKVGQFMGMVRSIAMGFATRKNHCLDIGRTFYLMKTGNGDKSNTMKQTEIAKAMGNISAAMVGQFIRCFTKLKELHKAKAKEDNWSLNKCLKVIDGYTKPAAAAGGVKRVSSKVIDQIIDHGIPDLDTNAAEHGLLDEDLERFRMVSIVLEYVQGRHTAKMGEDFMALMKSENFFTNVDIASLEELSKTVAKGEATD